MSMVARPPPVTKERKALETLSHSSIQLYMTCPLRFYFRKVEGLPEPVVSASLVTGSAIHRALETHFRELMVGHPPPQLDELLGVFWDTWRELENVEVRFNRGDDINAIGRLADRMLRAFQASSLARPQGTIIGIEEPLRGVLLPGVPDLVGRVDLLVEDDDAVTLSDYKTVRSPWSPAHAEDAGSQLLIYHQLVESIAGDKPIRLQFALLSKARVPTITLHPVAADPHRIARTKAIVKQIWEAIRAERFYPTPSAMNCPSCSYREQCRSWKG